MLGTAVAVAGCGSAAGPKQAHHVGEGAPRSSAITKSIPSSLRHTLAPVGSWQRVESRGAALSVRVRAVLDPLTGSGARLQPGTRAVGVVIQIANAGPAIYDSSATGDVRVVTSSGAVTPVLARRGVCRTPLEDFDRYITAGEDRVGCVVEAIATAAAVTEVEFSPHAEAVGRLVWAP